jgi:hypothetical protein
MRRSIALVLAAAFAFAPLPSLAQTLFFDTLGARPITSFGPIQKLGNYAYANSFSTGRVPFELKSFAVTVLDTLTAGAPPSGLKLTAVLLADSSNKPGAVLATLGSFDEHSIPATGLINLSRPFIRGRPILYRLAPHTRYWIGLTSNDPNGSLAWVSWVSSTNLTGTIGATGEYCAANGGTFATVAANGHNGCPGLMRLNGDALSASSRVRHRVGLRATRSIGGNHTI